MRTSFGSSIALLIGLGSANLVRPAALQGQPAGAPPSTAWTIARDPFADLWFHALAVIKYDGYGPLPLYDTRYTERAREAKTRAHIETTLDLHVTDFRKALAADSAFEVLHFLPLYFVGQEPPLVLAALRAAIRESPRAVHQSSLASTASVIAAALPTRQERVVFASLLDAVDNEWTNFVRADRSAHVLDDRRSLHDLESTWNDQFARSLDGYLSMVGITRGMILVSPTVGGEGRIIREPGGTVIVAVSSGLGVAGESAALLRVVRELAFPLLDQLRAPLVTSTTRVGAARERDAAAVRAGAIILDAVDKPLAAEYRRLFLDAIGGRAFENAFPLSHDAEMELRRLVSRAVHGAASGRTSYENY